MSITKHNAKAWAPIIQALADGKELQFNFDVSGWGSAWNIETDSQEGLESPPRGGNRAGMVS